MARKNDTYRAGRREMGKAIWRGMGRAGRISAHTPPAPVTGHVPAHERVELAQRHEEVMNRARGMVQRLACLLATGR